jgi:hypothetical protein
MNVTAAVAAPEPSAAAAAGGAATAARARSASILADRPAAASARLQRLLADTLRGGNAVPPLDALTGAAGQHGKSSRRDDWCQGDKSR